MRTLRYSVRNISLRYLVQPGLTEQSGAVYDEVQDEILIWVGRLRDLVWCVAEETDE